MYKSGAFVADHLSELTNEQIQPNGVDLTVDKIYTTTSRGHIHTDGKTIGDRTELKPTDGTWDLSPGSYVVRYGETLEIPNEHVGFVYPRSSLIRNSSMLHTAVWDAGYTGRGEGLLIVHTPIRIDVGARIAQLVYSTAAHTKTYDGTYQNENLNENND